MKTFSGSILAILFFFAASVAMAREPALEALLATVNAHTATGVKSVVIMDLDETVVDSHTRKYLAYRAATEELCGAAATTTRTPKSEDCERALGLSMQDIYGAENGYSQPELMEKLGVRDAAFVKDLYRLRRTYEDSPRWFGLDTLMPGASEFVRGLKRAGALVYFVSSRQAETLAEATYSQLVAHGLLEESEKNFVVLKPRGQSSLEFKRESARRIRENAARDGTPVVALFENEPANLGAWMEEFPEARGFFVKGSFATPAPVPAAAIAISTYR